MMLLVLYVVLNLEVVLRVMKSELTFESVARARSGPGL